MMPFPMPSIERRGIATQLGGELWVSDVMPLQKCISPVVELMRQAILPFGLMSEPADRWVDMVVLK